MPTIKERLQERLEEAENSDTESERIYFTEKQVRVLKAIQENLNANTETISEEAGCHPSYVTYITKRLPPETLRRLINGQSIPEIDNDTGENGETNESGSSFLEEFEGSGNSEADTDVQASSAGAGEVQQVNADGDTMKVQMTRKIPVSVTVEIPTPLVRDELGIDLDDLSEEEIVEEVLDSDADADELEPAAAN